MQVNNNSKKIPCSTDFFPDLQVLRCCEWSVSCSDQERWWTYQLPGPASRSHQGILGIFGFLDGQEWGEGASGGHGDHGDCSDHGDRGSEHREVVTRPGALLKELGVARHQVGEEALSFLGEAFAARGWRGAVGAARFGSLAPGMTPAPPQPDLTHSALEELSSVVVESGRRLYVLAAQRPGQMATLCRKRAAAQAPAGQLCP